MKVVSTSALPIDLAGQLAAALPGTTLEIPARGHVALAELDLRDADALVCLLLDRIDAAVLARAPGLRVVANCAVGIDNIDVAAATAANVWVSNTPDVLTEATAELAFALVLAAARRLGEGERLVRSGAWTGWALDQLIGTGLAGTTLGIVGFGRIGQALARRALGFGMHVVYADPHDVSAAPAQRVSLDALFETADVVSLHCPLRPETHHLVDARRLATMKPTAILVNTARGACVDEAALVEALHAGRLAGAALDVYAREPSGDAAAADAREPSGDAAGDDAREPSGDAAGDDVRRPGGWIAGGDPVDRRSSIDPALLTCPRLILTPHIGSATRQARTAMAQLCADAVIAALRGHPPANLVNNVVPPWSRRS